MLTIASDFESLLVILKVNRQYPLRKVDEAIEFIFLLSKCMDLNVEYSFIPVVNE